MERPKVSIIIPIYGVERYIERCSESLFQQTYENLEFLFVDDCSPDSSIDILKRVIERNPQIKDNVSVIRHIHNGGLAMARNTGVAAAKGDYVMHVDSDDYIDKNTVRIAMNQLLLEQADCVVFGYKHIYLHNEVVSDLSIPSSKEDYLIGLLERKYYVNIWGAIYKKKLYTDNKIEAIPGLNMGEDYCTKPRLIYFASKVTFINEPFYCYSHLNETSYTNSFNTGRITDVCKCVDILSNFFLSKSKENYSKSIIVAALTSKVLLLKDWATSEAGVDSFGYIQSIYSEYDSGYLNNRIDRLILNLAKYDMRHSLRLFIRIGVLVKSIKKII